MQITKLTKQLKQNNPKHTSNTNRPKSIDNKQQKHHQIIKPHNNHPTRKANKPTIHHA